MSNIKRLLDTLTGEVVNTCNDHLYEDQRMEADLHHSKRMNEHYQAVIERMGKDMDTLKAQKQSFVELNTRIQDDRERRIKHTNKLLAEEVRKNGLPPETKPATLSVEIEKLEQALKEEKHTNKKQIEALLRNNGQLEEINSNLRGEINSLNMSFIELMQQQFEDRDVPPADYCDMMEHPNMISFPADGHVIESNPVQEIAASKGKVEAKAIKQGAIMNRLAIRR